MRQHITIIANTYDTSDKTHIRHTHTHTNMYSKHAASDVPQVLQLVPQQSKLVGNRTTGQGLSGGQRKRVNVGALRRKGSPRPQRWRFSESETSVRVGRP